MTITYGLTSTGFIPKTTEVILGEIEADQRSDVSATIDQAPDQPLGQFNGIFASKLAEGWEILASVYKALDPDQSEGAQLDAACALTGTKRAPAKRSEVSVTVNLDASKTFNAGTMIANVNAQPTIKFRNKSKVVSTSAGNYTVVFESVDLGPIAANANTLQTITTPVTGWNSITNPNDAAPGALLEKDTPLRIRRRGELTKSGGCTLDSVRTDVLQVKGVAQCRVLENNTWQTDANGLPPKSFEVVIYDTGADDNVIAQTIWNSKPSGMQPYGSITATAIDSVGNSQTVKFSRATQKTVWFSLNVQVDINKYPSDGGAQIKAALVALGATAQMDEDVIAARYKAEPIYRIFGSSSIGVAGVLDVTLFKLDFVTNPLATANLQIGPREIAVFDTSRIAVTEV